MKFFNNIKVTGLSTPFGGISWENIDQESQALEILKDLYLIRRKLSIFYFSYDNDIVIFDEDEIVKRYFVKALNTNNEIAEIVFNSNFLVSLSRNDRNELIHVFDYVAYLEALMETDEDFYVEGEDQISIINDLITLFETIDEKINELNNMLDKKERKGKDTK